jgi:hypothetical protein
MTVMVFMTIKMISRDGVTMDGVGLVIGFIEHLQIVTTSNYTAIDNSHSLQLTTAGAKPSKSTVSSPVVAW